MKLRIAPLTILCLMLAVAPSMANTLYSNPGPAALTTNAWTINFGFSVSNSFPCVALHSCGMEDFHFVYWDVSTTDLLTTVDMQLGVTSFGGTPQTLTGVTNTFLTINNFGYALYQADYSFPDIHVMPGTNYVTLSNACTTSGCSVSNTIYWDQSSGLSMAYSNVGGGLSGACAVPTAGTCPINPIPSESFTLTGLTTAGGPNGAPEPSSIMLFASGLLGLAGALRRKLL